MSQNTGVQVKFSFHPTFHVPTLEEAEEFFDRAFGYPSVLMQTIPDDKPIEVGHLRGYSKMVMIRDVLIDYVCPSLHRVKGKQVFADVAKPVLLNIGWYSDDITATFRALRAAGVPLVDQLGQPAEGDEPPTPNQGGAIKMFFTPADQVGLRYQFMETFPMRLDPRLTPGWTLPPVSDDDPLGLVRLSHHVILTADPDRAVNFIRAIGGEVIHEGRDEQRGLSGPYVRLADAIYHYAVPDAGTAAAEVLAAKVPADKFYAMTFRVTDLDRAAGHLEKAGVGVASRTGDTLVTDPATSLEVPWGFTTAAVPGDDRG